MRIIDADALKTIRSIQSADYNSIETIQHWIDNAPTVDAIPVEWLKKVQTECVCDVQQIPMYVAIGWLKDMWQKEQEAR